MLSTIAFLALTGAQTASAPPKQSYDSKLDATTFSAGEVRTGGMTGMGADFQFAGKIPTRPALINVGFGTLRTPQGDPPQPDDKLLHWKTVTSVTLKYAGQSLSLPAVAGYRVSTNKTVQLIYGHALEEYVSVKLPTDEYIALVEAPEFTVVIGSETRTVKGKSLDPLRKLAASIPA